MLPPRSRPCGKGRSTPTTCCRSRLSRRSFRSRVFHRSGRGFVPRLAVAHRRQQPPRRDQGAERANCPTCASRSTRAATTIPMLCSSNSWATPAPRPRVPAARGEVHTALDAVLSQLPPAYEQVIRMLDLEGRPRPRPPAAPGRTRRRDADAPWGPGPGPPPGTPGLGIPGFADVVISRSKPTPDPNKMLDSAYRMTIMACIRGGPGLGQPQNPNANIPAKAGWAAYMAACLLFVPGARA